MVQLCIFGGYSGPLAAEKKIHFTVFGSCELQRPTLARQMINVRKLRDGQVPTPKLVFITLFGATEIKCPTLAEEFIDLQEAVRSGVLNLEEWDSYMAELDRWTSSSMMSLTLFGAYEESELPSENEEIEGLALQRHFGNIPEHSGRVLELGVGRAGTHRRTVLRQAMHTG